MSHELQKCPECGSDEVSGKFLTDVGPEDLKIIETHKCTQGHLWKTTHTLEPPQKRVHGKKKALEE